MEFLHLMIRGKNIEESLKFYQELFDMKLVKEKQFGDESIYFLADNTGEVRIELTYNCKTTEKVYELGTGFGHLAFRVDSMEEFTQKMLNFGYEYLKMPYKLSIKGSKIAFIKDPNGYEIELIEKKKEQ